MWTGGKDLRIKMWQLPDKFLSNEVESFESDEYKNLTGKLIEEKMEKINSKKEGEEDSDDDAFQLNIAETLKNVVRVDIFLADFVERFFLFFGNEVVEKNGHGGNTHVRQNFLQLQSE